MKSELDVACDLDSILFIGSRKFCDVEIFLFRVLIDRCLNSDSNIDDNLITMTVSNPMEPILSSTDVFYCLFIMMSNYCILLDINL
jgi:hypothetical protein